MPIIVAHRRLEWWLSVYTIVWGAVLVVCPTALDTPPYVVMRLWAPPFIWGGLGAAIGIFHLWALFINGRRRWSPFVRVAATICNAAIFTIAQAGVIVAMRAQLSPVSVTVLFHLGPVMAGVFAFYVAGGDMARELRRIRLNRVADG